MLTLTFFFFFLPHLGSSNISKMLDFIKKGRSISPTSDLR